MVFIILSNVIFGVVLIIFSIIAYIQTLDLPDRSALFPQIILYGMAITGVLMIIDALIKRKKQKEENESTLTKNTFIFHIVIPGAILLTAYGLLSQLGFYITSFLLIMVLFFYQTYRSYEAKLTVRHFLKGLLVATIVTVLMYVVFTVLLSLPTPSGRFF
ncbi:tripartite tricarboxylate transporter TctB family protein [Salipaludibacillus sp. HK11]|uniref:tripartite tricarboxylate transporter TctB family protein n=1 Tax=Salipaludibacillus sp. HK11 TaxID=3394320 RepID=UPI0039FCCD64